MAYSDFLWDILEKLHLADFFEDHDLPPILFLLLLLAILIPLAIFLVYGLGDGGSGEPTLESCGDGICQINLGESLTSCPEDCREIPETLKTVIVEIIGNVRGNLEVRLEDSAGYLIQADTGATNQFTMTGVREELVKVSVRNAINSRVVSSDLIELRQKVTKIPIGLPPDFFESGTPTPSKGTLRIAVKDSVTDDLLSATVTVVIPTGSSYLLVRTQHVDGTGYFTLDTSEWYALLAESPGYRQFNSIDSPITLEPGQEREYTVYMESLDTISAIPPGLATVNVCVRNQTGGLVTGSVEMYSATGSRLATQELSPSGCTTFELTSSGVVTFSTAGLPANCLDATSGAIQALPGATDVNMTISCDPDAQGRARVRIVCEGDAPLTSNATINTFYAGGQQIRGTGPAGSLALGIDDYTEYVGAASVTPFYFMVTGLPGFATHKSDEFAVAAFQNKSIDICIRLPPPPEFNITFQGLSYPNPVVAGSDFTVAIPTVLYGDTDITDFTNVTVGVAGAPCQIRKNGAWVATCLAQFESGEYDLIISATYEGREGVAVEQVTVLTRGVALFTLTPHALLDTRPPIDLGMDITFNNTPLDSLTDSRVTVIYEDGGVTVTDQLSLSGGEGLYYVSVDSPFHGQHRAEIYLNKITGGKIYEQNFTLSFRLTQTSVQVTSEESIRPIILEPMEQFTTDVRIRTNGVETPGLDNVFFILRSQRTNLPWNPGAHTYQKVFTSPEHEGIFPVLIELGTQALTTNKKIYVVDTTKNKADECDISNCQTVPQVRRCVRQHRLEGRYSDQETIRCIESGLLSGTGTELLHCTSSSANRGDWDDNCKLSDAGGLNDVFIMTEFLQRVPDQDERDDYLGCGDMDNDGDVDKDDLTCLKNVVATKWFGDRGDGDCSKQLRGGFCFDIERGVPGDFNNDADVDSDDVSIMRDIISATSLGVTPSPELLAIADFDTNGGIDNSDRQCLEDIAGNGRVPLYCLRIYGFGCEGTKGDINTNGDLDEIDQVIMAWMVEGRVNSSSVFDCADITGDGALDEKDLLCLSAIVSENRKGVEEYCTPCQIRMTELERYGDEICHDGLDNNCDGQIDEECQCDVSQRCDRKYDNDGLHNTNDFKYCRSLSWIVEGEWRWQFPEVYSRCTDDIQCETRACEGREWTCSSPDGTKGNWYETAVESLPKEKCGDGWDNDCVGGDKRCSRGGGGGGGCLYVYSVSNGSKYLDHLAYPFSIMPSWEEYSYGTMQHLKPEDGLLRVRLSEELPEITNINHIRLFAVDHPHGTEVMPDMRGSIRTLSALQPPNSCVARDGSDCMDAVSDDDEDSYIFDLETVEREDLQDAQDGIIFEFPKPISAETAKLVIKGEESGLITFVWWSVLERVGANNMQDFLASLDSGLLESLLFEQFANSRGKVSVQVWDGVKWLDLGSEYLGFSKYGKGGEVLMMLRTAPGDDHLRIRLLSPKAAFEIDYVGVDYSEDAPLILYELPMVSAEASDSSDSLALLESDDDLYLTFSKGGWVDVLFSEPAVDNDLQRSYTIAVKGHYTYDVKTERVMTPETEEWITRLITDEAFLLDYVMANYLQNREAFFRLYNG